jgi:hypothetical protein
MTAKQAIKARCFDCSGRECGFDDCALKGLAKAQRRVNRHKAIREYCQWCMNGHSIRLCASPDCAIYQYRTSGKVKDLCFEPQKPLPIMESGVSETKKVSWTGGTSKHFVFTLKNDHCGQRRHFHMKSRRNTRQGAVERLKCVF